MAKKAYAVELAQGTSKGLFGFRGEETTYDGAVGTKLGVVAVTDTNSKNVFPASPSAVGGPRITIAYTAAGKSKTTSAFCDPSKVSDLLAGDLNGDAFKGGKIDRAYFERDISYS